MTRATRLLLALCATLLVSAAPAAARTDAVVVGAPTGLHPFLLRVDEPRSESFSRTPAFAWNPVSGALRYEFQLSTSNTFRDNGIVYSDTSLTSPVASPALTLPWITGSPHSLFARVRAVLADTTTRWSDSFGFDMEPAAVPAPIASYPGLLRWTPTDGATGYQVWFVDLPKIIVSTTNVADLREFYSFHQAASWLSQVRWRIRALRFDYNERANGLPAVGYGPWSPVYVSVNPPFAVGPLNTIATVSDVVSSGARSAPAHRLTPAFVYSGNRSLAGVASELYRVQVFTDRGCVNRVYAGALVGSPAYAPRYSGPLALPVTGAGLTAARSAYLPDGAEGSGLSADFGVVVPNESLPAVTPTTGLPGGATPATGEPSTPAAPGAPVPPASGSSAPAAGTIQLVKASGTFGPPVSLWDTDWSRGGGYYWTVVPVEAKTPGAGASTVAGAGAVPGAVSLPVTNSAGFAVGDVISVGNALNQEYVVVTTVTAGALGLAAGLKLAHGAGEPVIRSSGNIQYQETELAQDACAAGRVLRFGKESEPALTSGGEPFVSGLSPTGKLRSATSRAAFYGAPLVAWTAALGADLYAVQWSKQRQPFVPENDPGSGALGMMTLNTSVVLPLTPGTWYYRVRGYDFSLPTGAQAMSWSDTQQVVATKPTFAVVRSGAVTKNRTTKEVRVLAGGFSVRVPTSWSSAGRSTASASRGPKLTALGARGAALRLAVRGGRGDALFVQTKAAGTTYSHAAWARKAAASMRQLRGRTGAVRCSNVSLPAGAAVRCALATSGSSGKQSAVVYLLRHRSATYTLTFASVRPGAAGQAGVSDAVARSFRFTS